MLKTSRLERNHVESTIPLNKLVSWSGNVRKTATGDGIEELMASIAAHGLLQSLVVRKTSRGKFAVVAGERRRIALTRLAEAGQLDADYAIPCRVISGEVNPTEISLAENVVRSPMHSADQFEAFRDLIDQGATASDIAARFGVSETIVTRRMKLGRVSPALLAVYRTGTMSLDQVQAFALTDDHAAQERVWTEVTSVYSGRSPQLIRRLLTEGEVPATDKRVRLVSLDAYELAGGGVRRDLFDERDAGYVLDTALLDRLVQDRLAEAAVTVAAEGWKWTEIREEFDWQERSGFQHIRPQAVALSLEDSLEFEKLNVEADALNEQFADGDTLPESTQGRLAEIENRLTELTERLEVYTAEALETAGAIVSLGHDGRIAVERGLIRHEDRETGAEDAPAGKQPRQPGLSAALTEALTQHKTVAIQAELATNPEVALAAVVHTLALRTFYHCGAESCLDIGLRPASVHAAEESQAADVLKSERERWGDHLPGLAADLWDWCLAQDRERLLDLLAVTVAPSVNAVQGKGALPAATRFQHVNALASALRIDMAAWFRPTAENYFGRVGKPLTLDALAEARQAPNAIAWAKLKKAELAVVAEQHIGATWLPELLRIEPASSDDGEISAELAEAAD